MKRRETIFIILLIGISLFSLSFIQARQRGPGGISSITGDFKGEQLNKSRIAVDRNFGKIPLYFIPNKGQVSEKALFYARTPNYTLWITKEGLVFDSSRKIKTENETDRPFSPLKPGKETPPQLVKYERDVSRLVFIKANKNPDIVVLDKADYRVNYFRGSDSSKWQSNIQTTKTVLYKEIYPNIDLKIYGIEKQIEYDWIVKPGAAVDAISFQYQDVEKTAVDKDGNLIITTSFGDLTHKKPYSYQVFKGRKVEVPVTFKKITGNTYGFNAGNYDRNVPLTIDPMILAYSTHLGGSGDDWANDIAVDNNGCAYICGHTKSFDFPLQNYYQGSFSYQDAFVSKISADGTSLVYSTYLGGANEDVANSIAVDNNGCAYITGTTYSSNFPMYNAFQFVLNYFYGGFLTKFTSDGSSLIYSTYITGDKLYKANAVTVNNTGEAYVTGTRSPNDGNRRNFASKYSADGSEKFFEIYGLSDRGAGIALDSSGCIYLTGYVSITSSYPYQSQAVVQKISADGKESLYYVIFGGSSDDIPNDIAVDKNNYVYIIGTTYSQNFPVRNAYKQYASGVDMFIVKIRPEGTNDFVFSTYFGGSESESGNDIAVDQEGNCYITGTTHSTGYMYSPPIAFPPYQVYNTGLDDAIFAKFSPDGDLLAFTYLGGGSEEFSNGIAIDNNNDVYLAGETWSKAPYPFPVKNAIQATHAGGTKDAFVSKLVLLDPTLAMTLTSPNGGEEYYLNSTKNITWENTEYLEPNTPIRLILVKGGTDVSNIVDSIDNILLSDKSYQWNVGTLKNGTALPGGDYTIRIESADGVYFDQSDANFTIAERKITITSPNGGESLPVNSLQAITWTSESPITKVNIDLSTTGVDGTYSRIFSLIDNTGSQAWRVPNTVSDQCYIRITSGDAVVTDTTDNPFSIVSVPLLEIATPNGSETWYTGSTVDISWFSHAITGNVDIALYQNDAKILDIASPAFDASPFSWTIPRTLTTNDNYKIRISQAALFDDSDTNFTIAKLQTQPDFNNDGKPDLVLRNYTHGQNQVWYLNGLTKTGSDSLTTITNTNWFFEGTGDFNGDGKPDILLREHQTGANQVWLMDGIVKTGYSMLPSIPDTGWLIGAVADFNKDGNPDILLRHSQTGSNQVWFMDGTTKTSQASLPSIADTGWQIQAAADFNLDGNPDLLIRHATTGRNQVWYMDGITRTGTAFLPDLTDTAWRLEISADFNLDGKPDLLFRNTTTGANKVWYMNNTIKTAEADFTAIPDVNWKIVN